MGRRRLDEPRVDPERLAQLQAIAGDGDLDERCANLARYFERIYFGPPPPPRRPRRWRARPPREHSVSIRPSVAPRAPKRHRGYDGHPKMRGWWRRCENCRRYLGREGCIHCDTPT